MNECLEVVSFVAVGMTDVVDGSLYDFGGTNAKIGNPCTHYMEWTRLKTHNRSFANKKNECCHIMLSPSRLSLFGLYIRMNE